MTESRSSGFPARTWAALGLGVVLQFALALGALSPLPAAIRVAMAFVVLVLLPGFAFVSLGWLPPGGGRLAPGWAFGFGVAWNSVLVLALRAAHVPFTVLASWSLASTALLWGGAALARRSRTATPSSESQRWSRGALAALALAMTLGVAHAARFGTPLAYYTDSPDHIGTIRRMIASGDAFPRDAFYKDAGALGEDPRKGLWHAQVALVSVLAKTDPVETWRDLSAPIVGLFVLNVAALGFVLGGGTAAAIAGWVLVLTYGGSMAAQFLREAVFSTKVGDQLLLAATVALIADVRRPSRASRLAILGLALGAVAAHIYYVLPLALTIGAFTIALALAGGESRAHARRAAASGALALIACLPFVLWRSAHAYAPSNPLHIAPQGLLTLWGNVRVVSPGVLWDWFGFGWLLFPCAAPWLWREGRRDPAVLMLLAVPVVVAIVLFFPPAVALLQPRIGYLMMRLVWMLPFAGLVSWLVVRLARVLSDPAGPRLRTGLGLAGVALALAPALADVRGAVFGSRGAASAEAEASPLLWREPMAWMRDSLPAGSVVLADPATSYAVPMMAGHYVVTLLDQHSSPNDSLALARLVDARDALDPYASWDRVRAVVRARGVTAIALNDRFAVEPQLDIWGPSHAWFRAERTRLDAAPRAFERVYDRDDFVVYRVRADALDALDTPVATRPGVEAAIPLTRHSFVWIEQGFPGLMTFELRSSGPWVAERAFTPLSAAAGDTITAMGWWHAMTRAAPGTYRVAIRFDRPLPGHVVPPAWFAKPFRKLVERVHHAHFRFRADHIPVNGQYGVDTWSGSEDVFDSTRIVVPADAADGEYTVRLKMLAQPHYPNYRLGDYFFDDDLYAGRPVGTLRVVGGVHVGGH